MFGFLKKLFGNKQDRDIKEIEPIVALINEQYEKLTVLSNDELRNKTLEFRQRIQKHLTEVDAEIEQINKDVQATTDILKQKDLYDQLDALRKERDEEIEVVLNEILPEAFAVVKETSRRLAQNEVLEVTATDFDRELLASKSDEKAALFPLSIEGDKAYWTNNWDAAGNPIKWNMVHYDVQLIGGIALHQGKIAEMQTGEGKTLVSTLPAYLNALAGEGVHLITVNDYLAKRDAEWMAPLHNFLFLTVSCIDNFQPHSAGRRAAYNADITYGTNNEFGFDYLRDNMVHRAEEMVQRKFHFTMIDEVDSVLIDDARTPLIISGPTAADNREELFLQLKPAVIHLFQAQRQLATAYLKEAKAKIKAGDTSSEEGGGGLALFRAYRALPKNRPLLKFLSEPGMMTVMRNTENFYMQEQSKHMHKADAPLYFVIEEKNRSVELTDKGADELGKGSNDPNLFIMDDIGAILSDIDKTTASDEEKVQLKDTAISNFTLKNERLHALRQLLKAYTLFNKAEEYVVMEGQVMIVDEQTGRIMDGRRYSDGLHQALEAKENVKIEKSTQTYATVTLQNYFRMYHKLAGMTGTAETEAQELWDIYKLDVMVIPTNKPIARDDREDVVYKTDREKYNAVIDEVVRLRDAGRPVLVGTTSVQISEMLSRYLSIRKIQHNVLNAKQHASEADIVAEAGKKGQVTIATNMAGRGTDIKISEEVRAAGGLAIIGTERHDSRRVDRQLRGRSGRQGDVGSSLFFVSLEDKLMRLFGSERIAKMMDRMGHKEGDVLQHSMITKSIERAQKKVEENNFGVRKNLLEYDDVMNKQRNAIYKIRRNALMGERLKLDLTKMVDRLSQSIVKDALRKNSLDALKEDAIRFFGIAELKIEQAEFKGENRERLIDKVFNQALDNYDMKFDAVRKMIMPVIESVHNDPNANFTKITIPFTNGVRGMEIHADMQEAVDSEGKSLVNEIEKSVTLALIDNAWKQHLRTMDQLKDQVRGASFEQKDPLVIYKQEAFKKFEVLMLRIRKEISSFLFRGMIPIQAPQQVEEAPAEVVEVNNEELQTNIDAQREEEERQRKAAANSGRPQQQAPQKQQPIRNEQKVKRNDPCPCGSGKKFKNCHGGN